MTIEDECERLVFRVAFLMMRFPVDDLKLREYIPETPVENIFYKSRKAAVSVPADYNDFVWWLARGDDDGWYIVDKDFG